MEITLKVSADVKERVIKQLAIYRAAAVIRERKLNANTTG